jgi:hypothetical protein
MVAVPYHKPDQTEITLLKVVNPYLSLWWSTQTVTNIPDEAVGWLVAQGWEISAMTYVTDTQPPTPRYAMSKDGMQAWQVLLSLCNSYTVSANEARTANQQRYNEILSDWKLLIYSTHTHFVAQDSQRNGAAGNYILAVTNCEQAIDSLIQSTAISLAFESPTATAALKAMDAKSAELETNASDNLTTIEALLTAQTGYLTSFLSDFSAKLNELDTNYTAHLATINTLLTAADTDLTAHAKDYAADINTLSDDYATHALAAPNYLSSLGSTELARIKEEFAASLAVQLQDLTDKGLYTSAVAEDITARNTRDKSERITQLNDELNRQKLNNQHKLYEQQVGMRTQVLNGRERLHQTRQGVTQWKSGQRERLLEQIQQIVTQHLAGIDKQHAARHEVSRTAMAERDVLFAQLQDAVKAAAANKERYATDVLQQASTLAEHKHKAIAETFNRYTVRLEGLKYLAQETMQLMTYQLEARNKLITDLYAFVERREDVGPEWKDMSELIVGLGDAPWLQP